MDELKFTRYWNKFSKFMPEEMYRNNKEHLAMFMNFVSASATLELKEEIQKQNATITKMTAYLSK